MKNEILNHNGCFLVRGDSGDCVKVVTETVFRLWDIFGGTVNSKGYKVLNPHIKALYGDSITVQRAEQIYQILKDNGFAASNVALGVGSFSMHCIEEEGEMKVFTRDTVSSAIKAVYVEFKNDDGSITKMPIYKDPKTDKETGFSFKKSQKGCCSVFWREVERYYCCYDQFLINLIMSDSTSVVNSPFHHLSSTDQAVFTPMDCLLSCLIS